MADQPHKAVSLGLHLPTLRPGERRRLVRQASLWLVIGSVGGALISARETRPRISISHVQGMAFVRVRDDAALEIHAAGTLVVGSLSGVVQLIVICTDDFRGTFP